ncbi:aldo/keto reductase [Hahella ganghwensis]|uniref:aldo/keto reductase n=1 Tax=Hahella ganghwensis TaxID=286420 RepID=UPI00037BECAA|nr:aldo/keto reductase [Hahella ganghwensis]
MLISDRSISRRSLILKASTLALSPFLCPQIAMGAGSGPLTRLIPSSSEAIPAVGLGSWITFNVGRDIELLNECTAVMAAFFEAGGRMIDSSPMYGSSQTTIGYGLQKLKAHDKVFSAEKVWTSGEGDSQMEQSRQYWTVPKFDLMQVHNLLSWESHLETLQKMKANGRVRYIGITTSHGRQHSLFEQVMKEYPLDFVQLTYNPINTDAEERLLPLAKERGIAVIVNRPFQQGYLTERLRRYALPAWSSELRVTSWSQFILKFIISHPAVTCAIPATTRVDHVLENMASASLPLPDTEMRSRMKQYIRNL